MHEEYRGYRWTAWVRVLTLRVPLSLPLVALARLGTFAIWALEVLDANRVFRGLSDDDLK